MRLQFAIALSKYQEKVDEMKAIMQMEECSQILVDSLTDIEKTMDKIVKMHEKQINRMEELVDIIDSLEQTNN